MPVRWIRLDVQRLLLESVIRESHFQRFVQVKSYYRKIMSNCPICGVLECPCGCFDGDDEDGEIEDGVR